MTTLVYIAHVWLNGILWRARGEDTVPLRIVKNMFVAVALTWPLLLLAPWPVFAFIAVTTWGLHQFLGHSDYQDFGTSVEADFNEWANGLIRLITAQQNGIWHDFLGWIIVGTTRLAPIAIMAAVLVHPAFLLGAPAAGLINAFSYLGGWALHWRKGPLPWPLHNGHYLGEFFTGIGFGLITGILIYAA